MSSSSKPRTTKGSRTERASPRALTPERSVLLIREGKVTELSPAEVQVDVVGWKAYGLAAVPEVWRSPFVVVDSDFARNGETVRIQKLVTEAVGRAGIRLDSQVIVRSSGTSETLGQRGQFPSTICGNGEIAKTVQDLASQGDVGQRIHWIIQQHHQLRAQGHFSNERHVSREKRDWLAEVELRAGRQGYSSRVAFRRWRDGVVYAKEPLKCSLETQITIRLKQVALWAHKYAHRIHFEWVWDGTRVILVQADREEANAGTKPPAILPDTVVNVQIGKLKAFRVALPEDVSHYKKLANAKLYGDTGYEMPSFFVLDKPEVIESILNGSIPDDVQNDLAVLTVRPLIIRTDGRNIPEDKREMLPRSDELRSVDEACRWLRQNFTETVGGGNLKQASVALIAHHFIPSVASAWARAEPDGRIVRIESLWGLPDGLYWFSHDTFEVDTQTAVISNETGSPVKQFPFVRKLRYKGTFLAPDDEGRWIAHRTSVPFDWSSSIRRDEWLSEIALTTRLIANSAQEPTAVMWLVDNHLEATKHAVLPWFHTRSEIGDTPKAAPRRKYRSSNDFRIQTGNDWTELKRLVALGKQFERVVVAPSDVQLIRNREFAAELGELAKANGFVIELAGGVLSHAFYILQGSGARIECVDLFGDDENVVEFDKLVRDKVSDVIIQNGERAQTVRLSGEALLRALRQKLVEEAFEALDAASGEDLISELADVAEVIKGLAKALEVGDERIESDRKEKYKRRGGFEAGTMLMRTATPRSLSQAASHEAEMQGLEVRSGDQSVIEDEDLLPSRRVYRRPDLRQAVDKESEKMLTIEMDINRIKDKKESLVFSFPDASGEEQKLALSVELRRDKGAIRVVVRLRRTAQQLDLHLE